MILPETMRRRRVLPNGVSVLAAVNQHIVTNLRRDAGSDLGLPSLWREAKMVVNETTPFNFYTFSTRR